MNTKKFWALLVASIFAISLSSCSSAATPTFPSPTIDQPPKAPQTPETPQTPQQPPAQPINVPVNGTCVVAGDLEGQFTSSSQMQAYMTCILPTIDAWIDTVYASMPHPAAYYYVPTGTVGTIGDGCPIDATVLQYCTGPKSVYMGQETIWTLYSQFGDAAPALVAAHEVTHHFQNMAGMPIATQGNASIRFENQADCGAGAFMHYALRQGIMNADDDIVDLAGALSAAGEAESIKRTHGTQQERLSSFDLAYLSSLTSPIAACVPFVPEVPIVAPTTN